jgi:hypothetical protein
LWHGQFLPKDRACAALGEPPVSLMITCRPEDVPAGSLLSRLSPGITWLRLALGPLDVAGTTGLVSVDAG